MNEVKDTIRQFVVNNFLFGDADSLQDNTLFSEEGIIDSTGILELVTFLEETFNINVEDEELIPKNLDSLNNIANYLKEKM